MRLPPPTGRRPAGGVSRGAETESSPAMFGSRRQPPDQERLFSDAEYRAGADARGAVHLREADAGGARDLPLARPATQLQDDLVHLPQSGGADRLTAGEASAVRVDRKPAVDPRRAALDQRLLLAVLAQPRLGEVHHLGAGLRVLQLRDVDVLRSYAGLLERGGRRLRRRRGSR